MTAKELTRRSAGDERGFTLVELLVVMLVLALLAAIAIPAFFDQARKARDADAKAAARTAETAMEVYATEHDGKYLGADVPALQTIEETLNDATLTVDTAQAQNYEVTSVSDTGNRFHITREAGGILHLTCDTAGDGGCPSGGNWG